MDKQPDITVFEKSVLEVTVKQHGYEFELMATLLNLYTNGFNLIGSYKLENNESNWVWLLLITRTFHSLRCSMELMKKGYYGQAMALIRMVTEDYFICGNCKKDQTIVDAIIHDKPNCHDGTTRFNYKKCATDMGSLVMYEKDYAFECKFVHCSSLSAGILTKRIDDDNRELRAVPTYDEMLFMACCEMLFKNGLLMNSFLEIFLAELSTEKVIIWRKTVSSDIERIIKWLDDLKEKYGVKKTGPNQC